MCFITCNYICIVLHNYISLCQQKQIITHFKKLYFMNQTIYSLLVSLEVTVISLFLLNATKLIISFIKNFNK